VNPHGGSPRPLLCFGCVEKCHDENAQTETNQQGKTDDEAVFHTRSLRSYQAAEKGPSAGTHPPDGYTARLGYPAAGWVLAAAYLQYVWTHLRWVPRLRRAALHLGLFEQPGLQRVFWHPARRCDSSGQVNHTLENGFGMSIAISRRSLREAGRRVFREPPLLRTFLRTLGRGGSCSSS